MDNRNSVEEVTIQASHRTHSNDLKSFVALMELNRRMFVVLGRLAEQWEGLLEDELMAMMWMEMLDRRMEWGIHMKMVDKREI